MQVLIEHLEAMARIHGATLKHLSTLRPMSVERYSKNDFSKGVLATIVEVYALACNIPEGRQAVRDLGLEPFLQDIEGK